MGIRKVAGIFSTDGIMDLRDGRKACNGKLLVTLLKSLGLAAVPVH